MSGPSFGQQVSVGGRVEVTTGQRTDGGGRSTVSIILTWPCLIPMRLCAGKEEVRWSFSLIKEQMEERYD